MNTNTIRLNKLWSNKCIIKSMSHLCTSIIDAVLNFFAWYCYNFNKAKIVYLCITFVVVKTFELIVYTTSEKNEKKLNCNTNCVSTCQMYFIILPVHIFSNHIIKDANQYRKYSKIFHWWRCKFRVFVRYIYQFCHKLWLITGDKIYRGINIEIIGWNIIDVAICCM